MIEYEICEIHKDKYLKVLKCSSDSKLQVSIQDRLRRKPVIVIIPGEFELQKNMHIRITSELFYKQIY